MPAIRDARDLGPTAGLTLAALTPDPAERGVLAMLRCFVIANRVPESQAWADAFALATQRWGHLEGVLIAAAVADLAQAALGLRGAQLRVMHPGDPGQRQLITPDEEAMMRMLRALRQDRLRQARSHLGRLLAGLADPGVLRAGLRLMDVLPPLPGGRLFHGRSTGPQTLH